MKIPGAVAFSWEETDSPFVSLVSRGFLLLIIAETMRRRSNALGFPPSPDDTEGLVRRIAEFRQGCSVLIESPHKPLPDTDRTWLVEKCRAWAAKLDAHLAALGYLGTNRSACATTSIGPPMS